MFNHALKILLILFCFLFFGIGCLILSFILFPIMKLTGAEKGSYAFIVQKSWRFFIFMMEFFKIIKVHHNLPKSNIKGKIIVSSHPSFIDIILLIGLIPKSTCIAKGNVLKNPFFKNIVKNLYIVNNLSIEELKKNVEKDIKEGFNIIIFPTGTRTLPEENAKIHNGAAVFSLYTGTSIVPIKISTDYPFLAKNQPVYKIGSSTVNYNIEIQKEINPKDFLFENEIISRKRICKIIKERI